MNEILNLLRWLIVKALISNVWIVRDQQNGLILGVFLIRKEAYEMMRLSKDAYVQETELE